MLPIITAALYLGEGHWESRCCLTGMFHASLMRKIENIKMAGERSAAMCKAVEEWLEDERNRGRWEGIREGKRNGRKKGKKEEKMPIIKRMYAEGMEESLIRRMTKCTKGELAAARS